MNEPIGWATTTVEELAANEPAAMTDGPFGSNLKSEHYTESGPRVIRLQNIGEGVFLDAEAHISAEHFASLRKHEANSGDVVVAMLGEELPRACLVPATLGPAIVKADCVRLRVHLGLATPAYVMAGLNSQGLRHQAAELMHGVGRPRLGLAWFRGLKFPLAPLPEQQRIVDEIESYFTRLDDAVATLERVERNLKRYRASVLKAAVEGRLVPTEAELARQEGRDYEPASVLLERILTERRRRWSESGKKGTYQEPTPPDTSKLPALPEGWCWASLDQVLSEPLSNGRSVPTATEGFPVLRLTALKDGAIDLAERKIGAWTAEEAAPFRVEHGDFLVARGNGSLHLVGRGALLRQEPDEVAYPDTIIRVRLGAAFVPELFTQLWASRLVRDQVERKAKTTAGIYKVNQTDLAECVIPLMPLAEQHRLLEEADRETSVIASGERGVALALSRATRLRQAILKWAFEGKLADQDPDDEPAAVLLERIKAERAAAAAAPAKKPQRARQASSARAKTRP